MALKDILSNSTYADDLVISIPDGKGGSQTATLGEMRSMEATERRTLINRQTAIEQAEAGLMTRINTLRQAGLLDDQMNPIVTPRADASIRRDVAAATGLDENDPLFGQVVKEFKSELAKVKTEAENQIKELKTSYGQLAGATQQAVKGYLDDLYRANFAQSVSKLPEELRADVKLESVMDFAQKRRLMDDSGRLDISAAVDRLTWEKVKEHERKQIQSSSDQVKADKAALAAMQRPNVGGPKFSKTDTGFSPVDDKGKTKSFDEAIAAAAQDDELLNSAARTASGIVQ